MKSSTILPPMLFVALMGCGDGAPTTSPQSGPTNTAARPAPKTITPPSGAVPIVLDELIGILDVRTCNANAATEEVFKNLLVLTNDAKELALGHVVVPERFGPAFGNPRLTKEREGELTYYEAAVPVTGLWHGLKITELASTGMPESDSGYWFYSFGEPFERVRAVLNSMGFGLDKDGKQPRRPMEEGDGPSLSVEDGVTVLSCEPFGTPYTLAESAKRAAAIRGEK